MRCGWAGSIMTHTYTVIYRSKHSNDRTIIERTAGLVAFEDQDGVWILISYCYIAIIGETQSIGRSSIQLHVVTIGTISSLIFGPKISDHSQGSYPD